MNMTRWLMVGALVVLGSTLARADIATGETYTIIFTAWDPGQTFNFIPTSGLDTGDFTNPDDYCPGFDTCFDPNADVGKGADPTPEPGEFSFSTDSNGNATLFIENTGAPISEVLISLTSNDGQLNPDQDDEVFTCSGGTGTNQLFTNCGFNNDGFEIGFWSVPEPSLGIILLLAFAAVIVVRARKGRASSSFARTLR
jgi:hypothetical protein